MRTILILMLLTASVFAQDKPAVVAAACGSKDIQFDVQADKSAHTLAQPDAGKARLYFVQDLGQTHCWGKCGLTMKMGLDGAWVGANQDSSYFSVSVLPGEHHLCARPQGYQLRLVGLAHFTAEAGRTYFFRTRIFGASQQIMDFEPIDSDLAEYLISSYPLSVSHPKQ